MKEHLRALLVSRPAAGSERNIVREFLQAQILSALQRAGAMIPLAFQGGTALRFLYSLHRFSEDLDFALERPSPLYDFRKMLDTVRRDLEATGYPVEIKVNDQKIVHGAFVSFPGLLFELSLSPHRTEALSVKIEVDTRPPAGAGLELTLVRRHSTLRLQHHDRSSLFAGKLHAVLTRGYPKGRDFYDLLWYLSDPDWPAPNLSLLNAALTQTESALAPLTPETWRDAVASRLRQMDWKRIRDDVSPFLEEARELDLLTEENLLIALGDKLAPGLR